MSVKPAERIKDDAPRAHFLATKIYWAVKELLEANTVLYDHEINSVCDGVQNVAKALLNTHYRDKRK